ncbi:MAG: hypothetical protein AMXMBFR33_63420 [Candidatus Xenobia bacterium]
MSDEFLPLFEEPWTGPVPVPGFLMGVSASSPEGPPVTELMRELPEHLMHRYQLVPLGLEGNCLRLGMVDPGNLIAIDDIRLITGWDIDPVPVSPSFVARCLGLGAEVLGQELPLRALSARARIAGPLARVELEMVFENPSDEAMDVSYLFPVPARAAVHGFEMRVGERVLTGHVKERARARQQFVQGLQAGHRAALLELNSDNVLIARVGNLQAGERVEVRLDYAEWLEQHQTETVFRFPLVVAPRYADNGATVAPRLPAGVHADTRLEIQVVLQGRADRILSSQHCIATHFTEDCTVVQLSRQRELLNRDFVLRFQLESQEPVAALYTEGEHFLLSLAPPAHFPAHGLPRDVVFLVDRSGSMGTHTMQTACQAVRGFLGQLQADERFAILAFNDRLETFGGDRFWGMDQREAAFRWLDSVRSDGGTEILSALERLLRQYKPEPGRLLCAVLLTDGMVGNEPQIYAWLRRQELPCRIFTLGLGSSVNDAFLRELAQISRATCELLADGHELPRALGRLEQETSRAVVTDLRLVDRGLNYLPESLAPGRPGDLFAARPTLLSGRCMGQGPIEVLGRWAHSGEEYRVLLQPTPLGGSGLPLLWARERVRALEDRLRLGHGSAREIVDMAVRFKLLTAFTAFVLVDQSEKVELATSHFAQPLEVEQTVKDISAQDFGPMDEEVALDKLKDLVDEAPIVRVVNLIVSRAINDGATSIRLTDTVEYRIGGKLQVVMSPPAHVRAPILCRLLTLAGLKPELDQPSRGRIELVHDGREFGCGLTYRPGMMVLTLEGELSPRLSAPGDLTGAGLTLVACPDFRLRSRLTADFLERLEGVIVLCAERAPDTTANYLTAPAEHLEPTAEDLEADALVVDATLSGELALAVLRQARRRRVVLLLRSESAALAVEELSCLGDPCWTADVLQQVLSGADRFWRVDEPLRDCLRSANWRLKLRGAGLLA